MTVYGVMCNPINSLSAFIKESDIMFRIVLICSHLQEPIFYRAVKSEVSCFTIFVNPSVLESCKNVR
ncbi:MAG TPA: hypothetical protein PLQ80_10580, partial [Candidatus Syntrophosphaera sp.]|nr:hypothetical protein [Candidatus Syntrophosphaera sp.]